MKKGWVKNFDELATTPNRKMALQIIEAGLDAINTEKVISNLIKLDGDILSIGGENFSLSNFKKIKVVGFGKASPQAALALEKILGDKITEGAVIGLQKVVCDHIEIFTGTHPRPSSGNVGAGRKIYEIIKDSSAEDLIVVLVSGGGSALLCYPDNECVEGARLYDSFLHSGKTISEINTIRKRLSFLKGGGLAKAAYPATVIGLIFSDVPGNHFEDVASGPTYKDKTTIEDAKKIIAENNLGSFDLIETPKEDKYFEKVHNFVLVSNEIAVRAMEEKSKELGFEVNIISMELYDGINDAVKKIFSAQTNNSVVLASGEPSIVVPKNTGRGGRNLHMGLSVINKKILGEDSVFISLASDGMDNSDAAGAIADKNTVAKMEKLGLDAGEYLNRFDSYSAFEMTGDLIMTGPTGANVSDLMILLNKK